MTKTNTYIWDLVSKTDPANTKHVNQRGGFTAIDAYSQIHEATALWGPCGEGWGFDWTLEPLRDDVIVARVRLWYRSVSGEPRSEVHQYGCCEWGSKRVDSDAPKKAVTDGLTKCFSLLGFNADVFTGRFDDNKYVQQRRREVAAEKIAPESPTPKEPPPQEPPPADPTKATLTRGAVAVLKRDVILPRVTDMGMQPQDGALVVADLLRAASEWYGEEVRRLDDIRRSDLTKAREWIAEWRPADTAPDFDAEAGGDAE